MIQNESIEFREFTKLHLMAIVSNVHWEWQNMELSVLIPHYTAFISRVEAGIKSEII